MRQNPSKNTADHNDQQTTNTGNPGHRSNAAENLTLHSSYDQYGIIGQYGIGSKLFSTFKLIFHYCCFRLITTVDLFYNHIHDFVILNFHSNIILIWTILHDFRGVNYISKRIFSPLYFCASKHIVVSIKRKNTF